MKYIITSISIISLALLIILLKSISNTDFISGNSFQILIKINLFFVTLLFTVIAYQIYHLANEVKKEVSGSRLTVRLVSSYAFMIIVPLLVLYFVSVNFLTKSIESWFNVKVESALEGGLNIGQKTLDIMRKDIELKSRSIAYTLSNSEENDFSFILSDLREKFDIYDAMIIDESGKVISLASREYTDVDLKIPEKEELMIADTGFHGNIDVDENNQIFLKTYQSLDLINSNNNKKYLLINQKVPDAISQVAISVESVYEEYQALTYSRNSLKVLYQISLSIILFLAILLSISLALYFSRRFTLPISILSNATEEIAKGKFDKRIPEQGKDELGMLVRSFNSMTNNLQEANKTLELNRKRIENSRNFLESIINNMSSGIVVIDEKNNVRLFNKLSSVLLKVDLEKYIGQRFTQILEHNNLLTDLVGFMNRQTTTNKDLGNNNFTLKINQKILSFQITTQAHTVDAKYILLIDDITDITKAQRNEAWAEVARRLAHEIKNPLTPIQLSAERIDYKFSKKLQNEDKKILGEITKTIVNQVVAIKNMVNEFTEYSRSPMLKRESVDLISLINEVIRLYEKNDLEVSLSSRYKTFRFECDQTKLRQVIVNLIQNAYEAKKEKVKSTIDIKLSKNKEYVQISFKDNGIGFNSEIDPFEPYVTTKKTGTGLGLAVVKKIIEEHNGNIIIKNNERSGVTVKLQFKLQNEKSN
jgi:nitrogen fixation/metabolism regulation signal transduction histidine kinase